MPSYLPTLNWPIYSGWTQFAPTIPKMYWNVYSQEQRIKELCCNYSKVQQYLDFVAEDVNKWGVEYSNAVQAILDDYDEEMQKEFSNFRNEFDAALDELNDNFENLRTYLIELVLEIGEGTLTWDVQEGIYTDTVTAQRDMFNDVSVHAITVDNLASLTIEEEGIIRDYTVADLANSGINVKGLALMSRWLEDSSEPIYPDCLYIE